MEEVEKRTYKKTATILGVALAITLCFSVTLSILYLEKLKSLSREELTAEVIVDANDFIGAIDRNIYGHFIEHMDNCVYNGVWVGNDSSILNQGGLRKDVLEAVRAIKAPIIRWPGGNFASRYHWEHGVGPPKERPNYANPYWHAEIETNQFGTHEFMGFCREVYAEPYIVVNMVTGNSSEAAHWVEYCNSREGIWSQKRAANGHPEPFNVTYWGLGNEMYGDWQYENTGVLLMNATKYANRAVEFAEAMRNASPIPIKLIAVGCFDDDAWNREVLEVAGHCMDYLSVHRYYDWIDYYTVVAHPLDTERCLKDISRLIDEVVEENGRKVEIAFDEWNLGYDGPCEEAPKIFQDALFAAGMLNMFHRMCNNVTMANLAQLANVLHACIVTNEQGQHYVTPMYLAFKLYAENTGDIALNTQTKTDYYLSYGIQKVTFLDCSATIDENSATLYIAAINRHKTEAVKCEIELKNFNASQLCTYQELNADNVTAKNDFLNPNNVKITGGSVNLEGNPFFYTFPPHSVTILKFETNSSSL